MDSLFPSLILVTPVALIGWFYARAKMLPNLRLKIGVLSLLAWSGQALYALFGIAVGMSGHVQGFSAGLGPVLVLAVANAGILLTLVVSVVIAWRDRH